MGLQYALLRPTLPTAVAEVGNCEYALEDAVVEGFFQARHALPERGGFLLIGVHKEFVRVEVRVEQQGRVGNGVAIAHVNGIVFVIGYKKRSQPPVVQHLG